ncbi:M23 family metallopeptidase [Salinarimonas sp. NSM]|uniref:M23 family metallopeptidase n=1 Tax=Salinarimonas sp. NSM TaxID=3458003 RepID=UPI004036BE98
MTVAFLGVFVLQLATPLALLCWLVLAPPRDAATSLAAIAFTGTFVTVAATIGSWAIVPRAVLVALFIGFGLAAARAMTHAWRLRLAWPESGLDRGAALLLGVLAMALAGLGISLAGARQPPPGPVADIAFPLADGRYVVGSGGFHDLVNNHRRVLGTGRAELRGQAHAIDFLAVDRWGLRATGILPADPAAYAIFGKPVVAPCAGRVIRARGDLPDLQPPRADRQNLAGNHVVIACDGFDLLLAHLARDSLAVSVGEPVAVGDPIGLVGNSGNTTEPHLHVHAQRGGGGGGLLDSEPVALSIEGRFLIRNDTITVR